MTLSRKYYIMLAKVITDQRRNWSVKDQALANRVLDSLAKELAYELKCDNPAFDRSRFLIAATVEGSE